MTIADTLLNAIESSGETLYRIGQETDLDTAGLFRFVNGQTQDPRLSTVQKLADYFGLELRPKRRR